MWRSEDEALLRCLEDEAALATLWRAEAPAAKAELHPRAAGLVRELRALDGGEQAAARAVAGDARELASLLRPKHAATLPPRLLHHLALYETALADEVADDPSAAYARAPRLRAVAAWLALAEEGRYLRTLSEAVVAGAVDEAARQATVEAAVLAPIEALGVAALAGAPRCEAKAARALLWLSRLPEALAASGCGGELRQRATRRAERLRSDAIDAATADVDERLEEAGAREVAGNEVLEHLEAAVEVWRWARREPEVARFVVDRALPVAWVLYNHKQWDPLRRLDHSLEALVDAMADHVIAHPGELSYASRTAQMLVFRAELERRFDEQLVVAERALSLCSSHRNAKVVLADLLAERALRTLEGGATPNAFQRAKSDIVRAESLRPDSPRIKRARERLDRARRRR